jgi:hypothetical protein
VEVASMNRVYGVPGFVESRRDRFVTCSVAPIGSPGEFETPVLMSMLKPGNACETTIWFTAGSRSPAELSVKVSGAPPADDWILRRSAACVEEAPASTPIAKPATAPARRRVEP